MKKPLTVMLTIILIIIVVAGGGAGAYWYLLHHHSKTSSSSKPLSATQAAALQVTLPQMTTNLKSSGLIQFTLTLQSNDKSTKAEVDKMQNQIEDRVNQIMRQFTADDLRSVAGLDKLKATVRLDVNSLLPSGNITSVYFSQVLVQ